MKHKTLGETSFAADERFRTACRETSLELWPGCRLTLDPKALTQSAIAVKGCMSDNPLRFLEIFANDTGVPQGLPSHLDARCWGDFTQRLFPHIPGVDFLLGPNHFQPPYCWKDGAPYNICRSFTYNTNAFYRIFLNLCDRGCIHPADLPSLLERACRLLAYVYKANNSFVLKHINNNINMYLISKTVEFIVGKNLYDNERQESDVTMAALAIALQTCDAGRSLSTQQKMALAVRRGVSFIEERFCRKNVQTSRIEQADALSYFEEPLAIDHRETLIEMIESVGISKSHFSLVVVVDDATETVADLCWIADLLQTFPFLLVSLLVNTAQISVNFSADMLASLLSDSAFRGLATIWGSRLRITRTYCPFISLQTNFLMADAVELINSADAVFIKGANFFETLQIAPKETFYGFVVYGPVSQTCTGLDNFNAVWAHVPAGEVGYKFSEHGLIARTLRQTIGRD